MSPLLPARMTLVQLDSTGMWRVRDESTGDVVARYAFRSDAVEFFVDHGYTLVLQNAIGSTWAQVAS